MADRKHERASIRHDQHRWRFANVSDRASKCPIVRGVVTESSEAYELSNVVETALARALVLAAEAKRWDVVLQIAGELHRRPSGARRGCSLVDPGSHAGSKAEIVHHLIDTPTRQRGG